MPWDIEHIRHTIGGKIIGNAHMRQLLYTAISYLPADLAEQACRTIWYISSQEDAWALTFRGADLENRHLIFFSDLLLEQDQHQIRFTMLHEIGHVLLGHRNSIGVQQSQEEVHRQEQEADTFAGKYLEHIA